MSCFLLNCSHSSGIDLNVCLYFQAAAEPKANQKSAEPTKLMEKVRILQGVYFDVRIAMTTLFLC